MAQTGPQDARAPQDATGAGARRFRDVLAGRDAGLDSPELGVRTGVVTAKSTPSGSAWVVAVQLGDGTVVNNVPLLTGYDPRIGDSVLMLMVGPQPVVLGGFGGLAQVPVTQSSTPVVPPTPPAPPTPPPTPPTQRTVYVSPDSTATWSPGWGPGWRSDNDDMYQTGTSSQRGFLFYGSKIAAARGSGQIVAATVYLQRLNSSHGVNGAANLRLGVHSFGSRPADGSGALGSVSVPAQLTKGQGLNVKLTAAQIAALNGGMAGLGLEPGGVGTSSADYLIASGKSRGGPVGQLALTIQG